MGAPSSPGIQTVKIVDDDGRPVGPTTPTYTVTPNRSTFTTAKLVPAAAGTAEQAPDQAVPDGFAVLVKALKDNADLVYVGESKAAAEAASAYPLDAAKGEFVTLYVTNINAIWVRSVDAGNADGVSIIVEV